MIDDEIPWKVMESQPWYWYLYQYAMFNYKDKTELRFTNKLNMANKA